VVEGIIKLASTTAAATTTTRRASVCPWVRPKGGRLP